MMVGGPFFPDFVPFPEVLHFSEKYKHTKFHN